VAFTKTATTTHNQNEGRLRTHFYLIIGAPERVCPVAPCRGRTGPRPEVLEKRSAFGLTGAWRQSLYLTCDTARDQRWVLAYTTRQAHQEALALASATPVQPSLSAPPSVGHCLSSRVPMTDFTFFWTFAIHELLWFLSSPLNWVYLGRAARPSSASSRSRSRGRGGSRGAPLPPPPPPPTAPPPARRCCACAPSAASCAPSTSRRPTAACAAETRSSASAAPSTAIDATSSASSSDPPNSNVAAGSAECDRYSRHQRVQ
jgi:hypothetical protein